MAEGDQEMQSLAQEPVHQARPRFMAVRIAMPQSELSRPAARSFSLASSPSEDREAQQLKTRCRILCVSTFTVIHVVVGGIAQYVCEWFVASDVLSKTREIMNLRHKESLAAVIIRDIPSEFVSIFGGLLLPACGYVAVKTKQPCLIGCFTCCNALHCCCALVTMIICTCMMGLASTFEVQMQSFFVKCDPVRVCAPTGINQSSMGPIIDCLSTGTWEDYEPHFHDLRYPLDCPKAFLQCGADRDDDVRIKRHYFAGNPDSSVANPSDFFGLADASRPRHEGLRRLEVYVRPAWVPSRSRIIHRNHMPPFSQFGEELLGQSSVDDESINDVKEAFLDFHERVSRKAPIKPSNAIHECTLATRSIEVFHQAERLVPELMPSASFYLSVKLFFSIPMIVLGCLGSWWGKDLWVQTYRQDAQRIHVAPIQSQPMRSFSPHQGNMLQIERPLIESAHVAHRGAPGLEVATFAGQIDFASSADQETSVAFAALPDGADEQE